MGEARAEGMERMPGDEGTGFPVEGVPGDGRADAPELDPELMRSSRDGEVLSQYSFDFSRMESSLYLLTTYLVLVDSSPV